jgi:hypothetical protein
MELFPFITKQKVWYLERSSLLFMQVCAHLEAIIRLLVMPVKLEQIKV